ncbi:uncharacterized protein [Dendropsophus ebraccatus]|uniref:uncharacterized protein n=1 Tax=Dendropsophus ebraccatus TaxID=150705 RepID=UPI003831310F
MCPIEYFKKHPEIKEKKMELHKKYGFPDFSKLKSCSSDEQCDNGRKCCETPCGTKCMPQLFESNALETLEQLSKEIGMGPSDAPYETTEEDKKYGMCPNNYIKKHPELREEMEKKWKHNCTDKQCKHGERCSGNHTHHRKHGHFRNYTAMTDCSADGDCGSGMRCCETMCGNKCMKGVFTNEEFKQSLFGKREKKEEKKSRTKTEGEDTGVCPREYFKNHREMWKKKTELHKKYGFPNFSKLKSCSSDEQCDNGRKCCDTPCGMKCMPLLFESNAMETLEQLSKEIGMGPADAPYETTEEDKKYGMCPNNYIKTHPELREEMEKNWKHNCSDKQCKHGERCSGNHSHHKKHGHFRNFTAMTDCSTDGDCGSGMRCCETMCGKKCVKGVFTNEDFNEFSFGKKEQKENRKKREVEDEDDNEMERGGGHGNGRGQGKGSKNRKGKGSGGQHGKCKGKGECENGKGGEHGKGCKKGGEGGKGRKKGGENGKGRGKGQMKAQGHEDQGQEEHFRQKRSLGNLGQGKNELGKGSQKVKRKAEGKGKNKGKGEKRGKGKEKGKGKKTGKGAQ